MTINLVSAVYVCVFVCACVCVPVYVTVWVCDCMHACACMQECMCVHSHKIRKTEVEHKCDHKQNTAQVKKEKTRVTQH